VLIHINKSALADSLDQLFLIILNRVGYRSNYIFQPDILLCVVFCIQWQDKLFMLVAVRYF